MAKRQRHRLVRPPVDVSGYKLNIRDADHRAFNSKALSVIICTYKRGFSLKRTLASLDRQTEKNFEVVLISERGHLSFLRNKGANRATAPFISFIDDDVEVTTTWVENILKTFSLNDTIIGVTGP